MAITLNSKKYQVYISSTHLITDALKLTIVEALLELDCIPVGSETLFKAGMRWPETKNLIEESDYFILIFGGVSKENMRLIEAAHKEYEYSFDIRKPMLAFLNHFPLSDPKLYENVREKLSDLKNSLQPKIRKDWSDDRSLGLDLRKWVENLILENPSPGWVKSDLVPIKSGLDIEQELRDLKMRVDVLEKGKKG